MSTTDNPADGAQRLEALADEVQRGEAAQQQRADLIRALRRTDPAHWTQERLASHARISQAAVSKLISKQATFDWTAIVGGVNAEVGSVKAADLDEAVEKALEAAKLELGDPETDDDPYAFVDLHVQARSKPQPGGWATVYEPVVVRAHWRT